MLAWFPFLSDPLAVLSNPLDNPGAFFFLIAVFLSLTGCLALLLVRRKRKLRGAAAETKPTPDAMKARQILERILSILAKHGFPKNHRFTLEQFLAALAQNEEELDVDRLALAFESYQQIRFGAKDLSGERHKNLMNGLEAARSAAAN